MKLTLINPQERIVYDINHLDAQTPLGSCTIQPGHAPIILSLLYPSTLSFQLETGENHQIYLTRSCFLEVTRTEITALLSQETR